MGRLTYKMAASAMRFGKHLKELRIHLCQQSPASQGVRDFIEQQYVGIKKANPGFPILIRECSGVQPRVYARFELGREECVGVSNMTSSQVYKTIEGLAKE